MELPHVKAILFDWDLTLVQPLPVMRRAFRKVGMKYGVDLSSVTMREIYGGFYETALHAFHAAHVTQLPDREAFVNEILAELVHAHRALELTHERLLRSFRERGLKMGLVTYNIYENVIAVLKKSDFHFDTYVTYDDLQRHDSKATGIAHSMKALGVTASETLYVGDTINDITSALEAGIRVAAVTTGVYSREELTTANPTIIIDNLRELEALVPVDVSTS